MSGLAVAVGGAALVGSYMAANATQNAAQNAASSQNYATDQQVQLQQQALQQYNQAVHPYAHLGESSVGQLGSMTRNPSLYNQYSVNAQNALSGLQTPTSTALPNAYLSSQYQLPNTSIGSLNLPGYEMDTPTLSDSVDFNFDNDPIYQAQKEEVMRSINNRSAAMGKLNSSEADNAVANNISSLMGQSYDRQVGDIERANANAMARYGVSADNYNRGYQNAMAQYGYNTDAYNRNLNNVMTQYGMSTDDYNRASQNAMNQYGMNMDAYNAQRQNIFDIYGIGAAENSDRYNRLLTAANMGLNAATGTGTAALNTASNTSAAVQNASNANQQAQLATGQANAQMWNTLGTAPINAYAAYQMGQQPTRVWTPNNTPGTSQNTGYGNMQYIY